MNNLSLGSKLAMKNRELTTEKQQILKYIASNRSGDLRTVATKLIEDTDRRKTEESKRAPIGVVQDISNKLILEIDDIRAIQRSLPETETAKDILVSSILSPHDMITEEVNWKFSGGFPAELGQLMMGVIEDYFTQDYRLNDQLSTYLGNILFDRGSHILAVFPESSIDDIINSRAVTSMESVQHHIRPMMDVSTGRLKHKGVLGRGLLDLNPKQTKGQRSPVRQTHSKPSLESFFFGTHEEPKEDYYSDIIPGLLRITDNEDLVKLALVQQRLINDQTSRRADTYSLESAHFLEGLNNEEIKSLPIGELYRKVEHPKQNQEGILIVNDRESASRKPVGHPMILDIPHESCIPLCVPGNVEEKVGYLILVDETGHLVSAASERDNLSQINDNFNQFQGQTSGMQMSGGHNTVVHQTISDLAELVTGKSCNCDKMNLMELRDMYIRVVERDLVTRFNDGVYGKNIHIPRISEIYNIMFARMLSGSMTQLLYLPESLVTYMAFYFNDFGIGESLITRAKNLAAIRISTIYANAQAIMKNAVGSTKLKINLDNDVQDVEERVAKYINRYLEVNGNTPLFHTFDPRRVTEALFRNSIEVVVDGHDGIDQTTVETEYRAGERPLIDNDYLENNKKDFINALHVIPQLFDDSEQPQFSAEFTTKNVLFAKRNYVRAQKFNTFLKEFVTKATINDGALVSELSQLVREKYTLLSEELIEEAKAANSCVPVIEEFLSCLEVGIPVPELGEDSQTKSMFDAYSSKLDTYLPAMLDQDLINHLIAEDDPEKKKEIMGNIQELVKKLFMRDWIRTQNAFPEFDDMFYVEGKPNKEFINQIITHQENIAELVGEIINYYYEKNNPPEGEDSGGSEDTTPASGEDDGFSTDDSGSDDDSGDEPPEDDEPSEDEDESDDEEEDKSDEDDSDDEDKDEDKEDDAEPDESKEDDAGDGDDGDSDDLDAINDL